MRILINASCLGARPSGARQRFLGLYSELLLTRPYDDFFIYESIKYPISPYLPQLPNLHPLPHRLPQSNRVFRHILSTIHIHRLHKSFDFHIYEQSHLPLIRLPSVRTLLTVHDVRGLHSKWFLSRSLYSLVLRLSLKNASHLIVVSEFIMSTINALEPGCDISVIPNAIDPAFRQTSPVQTSFTYPEDFLLSVGHLEKRKNYARLIHALMSLRDEGINLKLIIVGNDSGELATLSQMINNNSLSNDILLLHSLPASQLSMLYQKCRAVVFPSVYEGFGIPVLEAISAGKPLILSNIPPFIEITQKNAFFFDPYSVTCIASAIKCAINSEGSFQRFLQEYPTILTKYSTRNQASLLAAIYHKSDHQQ